MKHEALCAVSNDDVVLVFSLVFKLYFFDKYLSEQQFSSERETFCTIGKKLARTDRTCTGYYSIHLKWKADVRAVQTAHQLATFHRVAREIDFPFRMFACQIISGHCVCRAPHTRI